MTAVLDQPVTDRTDDLCPVRGLGDPVNTVTYPISVEYVQQWDLPRALAEAVSNAIDADPEHFSVTYDTDTQELVIEDHAEQGVGIEGMVFGWSDKRGRDDVIGQFGEGLKIATIRAVSDPTVRHMLIESVGMSIVPVVAEHQSLPGLSIPVKSSTAPKVLSWNLYPSTRTMGTKVRVGIDRGIAQAVMSRFRHVTVPGYRAPEAPGLLIHDEPGHVYIGGVFVTKVPGLTFGYDLALATAKQVQNRDRTVVENHVLAWAIAQVQMAQVNPGTVATWVRKALRDKGGLHDMERGLFTGPLTADSRRMWAQVAHTVLGDPAQHYYRDAGNGDDEIALSLRDENMVEVHPNGLTPYLFNGLMQRLGVERARRARASRSTEQPVQWTKDLSTSQADRLNRTVAFLRCVFGADAVDKVRVFDQVLDHTQVEPCAWDGFYTPGTGQIAVNKVPVDDDQALFEVLFHETAHRVAHRNLLGDYGQHQDRTREFERALGDMGALLARHLMQGTALADVLPAAPVLPRGCQDAPSGQRVVFKSTADRHRITESIFGDQVRATVQTALDQWARDHEVVSARSLYTGFAKANFVTSARVRGFCREPLGSKIDFQWAKDVCTPLGVNPGVVWWATTGTLAVWFARGPASRNRQFNRTLRVWATRALADVEADPRYADLTGALRDLMNGQGSVRPEWEDDEWTAPLRDMVARMVTHAGDGYQETLGRVSVPGDPMAQRAWDAMLAARG